jgi:hypothetical protein
MRHRLAACLMLGSACASIGASQAQSQNTANEDFATFKAQHLTRLQKELVCVEAAASFETMRACMPPAGEHRGPPPDQHP